MKRSINIDLNQIQIAHRFCCAFVAKGSLIMLRKYIVKMISFACLCVKGAGEYWTANEHSAFLCSLNNSALHQTVGSTVWCWNHCEAYPPTSFSSNDNHRCLLSDFCLAPAFSFTLKPARGKQNNSEWNVTAVLSVDASDGEVEVEEVGAVC